MTVRTDFALLNRGHHSRWGNLGWWEGESSYPDACRALATRLGDAIGLGPDDRVLDVGCGAGEQLALWEERYGVRSLVGVDLLAENVRLARKRSGAATRVEQGSATELSARGPFDAVLALDCAYHFRPRAEFLRQAAERCAPGARLGLTDLVLGERAPEGLRALSRWAAVPAGNLLREDDYRRELLACGWEVSGWERIDAVLNGFAQHALSHHRWTPLRRPLSGWPKVLGTGLALRGIRGRDWLRYVLVTAVRA